MHPHHHDEGPESRAPAPERTGHGAREGVVPGAVFTLAYVAFALLTLRGQTVTGGVDVGRLIWFPSGLALAFVVRSGLSAWPWIFLAETIVTLLTDDPILGAIGTGAGSTAEALVAAWMLGRIGFSPTLGRWRDVVALIALGAGISSMVGGAISVLSLTLTGAIPVGRSFQVSQGWWLSHANGILLVTPLLLTLGGGSVHDLKPRRWEGAVGGVLLVAVASALFFTPTVGAASALLLYVPVPGLLWAAFRFKLVGAAIANTLLILPAILGTASGYGPLVGADRYETVARLSVFMAVVVLTSLVVAGVVGEREEEAAARLAAEEERLEMSERMHQAQKLESLGVLAGGIAHDFNNLLATIMGNADLAESKLDLAHPAGDHVSEVLRASRRAADLCRQILAYAGRGQVSSGVVDLNEVVEEMVELLGVSLPKDARLVIHVAPDCPPVWGDVTQLRQIVLNLLTNAADALPKGKGDIKVTTGPIEPEAIVGRDLVTDWFPDASSGLVHLTVEDTGPGLEESVRARVFEPFFSTKEVGRGLGLAVVLGIVRAHGGALELRSWPGHGSRFRVILPVTDRVAVPVPPALAWDDLTVSLSGTVLLADDEPGVREVCRLMLEAEGMTVIEAVDGQEAVEIFLERRSEIHMVLLDITMPRMNGYQALVKIREIDGGARVLLSTGNVQEAEEVESEWGVPLLAKPYGAQELRAAVARVLSGQGRPIGSSST